MIKLTRFNGDEFTLNAIQVLQVESLPDTTITLLNGNKLVVKDSHEEVIQRITNYYQTIGLQRIYEETGDENE